MKPRLGRTISFVACSPLSVSRGRSSARRKALALAFALALLAPTLPARADGSGAAPSYAPQRATDQAAIVTRRWYGYQTMLADVASTTAFVMGAATLQICVAPFGPSGRNCDNTTPGILLAGGTLGYAFGAPLIHAAHGHWDKAGTSFALRVVPAGAGVAIGSSTGSSAAVAVMLVGCGTSMIVDSAVLAYETEKREPPQVSFAPSYDPKSGAGSVVVAGVF